MATSRPDSATTRHERAGLASDQLDALRKLLETEQETLSGHALVFVDEHGQVDPTSATHGQGETEHTAIDIERRVNDVLEANTRDALVEITSALGRMDEGRYGFCEDCGSLIPNERLVAMPAARFCVRCQTRHDLCR
jgi:RNA polymerase-binding transcription factor DksA